MTRRNLKWSFLTLLAMLWTMPAVAAEPAARDTELDRYVATPDPAYSWKVVHTDQQDGLTTYVVDLKSQTWRTTEDVDRTLWQHWLVIVKPEKVTSETAFLFIGGGANGRNAPTSANELLLKTARATGAVAAEIQMIPNQPLVFHDDGQRRTEDDLIGYAWDQFLKTGDPTWLPRFPMSKAVVRAMDTIQEFLASQQGGRTKIDDFYVAGGSKRGWTTWITAAVDQRVRAMSPIVIDVVNVDPSMRHHFAAYGFWAPAVWDYVRHKIMERNDTPEMAELNRHVDPYSYRDRFTMPKYIVNAAGDEFFLPDSSQFYFDDLPGEKYLRYVPNSGHSLAGTDAPETVVAFFDAVINDRPRPKFSWTFEDDGSIRVTTEDRPKEVKFWQASNELSRDFRISTIGQAYTSTDLNEVSTGVYVGRIEEPEKGWTAFFVELTYDLGGPAPVKFTTAVRVLPDTLPHADKDPTAARRRRGE